MTTSIVRIKVRRTNPVSRLAETLGVRLENELSFVVHHGDEQDPMWFIERKYDLSGMIVTHIDVTPRTEGCFQIGGNLMAVPKE